MTFLGVLLVIKKAFDSGLNMTLKVTLLDMANIRVFLYIMPNIEYWMKLKILISLSKVLLIP